MRGKKRMFGVIEGRFYTAEAAQYHLGVAYTVLMLMIRSGEIEAIPLKPHRPRSDKLILADSLEQHPKFRKRPRRR